MARYSRGRRSRTRSFGRGRNVRGRYRNSHRKRGAGRPQRIGYRM